MRIDILAKRRSGRRIGAPGIRVFSYCGCLSATAGQSWPLGFFLVAITSLCSLSATAQTPASTPSALKHYLKADGFDPGDFAWAKSGFNHKATSSKQWTDIVKWAQDRIEANRAHIRKQAKREGYKYNPAWAGCFDDEACEWIVNINRLAPKIGSWNRLKDAVPGARQAFLAYRTAVTNATSWTNSSLWVPSLAPRSSFEATLRERTLPDQMFRKVMLLEGPSSALGLTRDETAVFGRMAWIEVRRRDLVNTRWLKEVLNGGRWSMIFDLGVEARAAAWLIVRHSDDDPMFMIKARREVFALIKDSSAKSKNYATMFDEISLDIEQKQYYGTQVSCDGQQVHSPSIAGSIADVNRRRAPLGMTTLQQQESEMLGICSKQTTARH